MKDYLSGYLEVLPAYQRKKVEEIINENKDLYHFDNISEDEFKEIMRRLEKDHTQLTTYIPQSDKVSHDDYNRFYSSAHIDLNLMFLESQLIENALANYDRIFDGIIGDLEKEIRSLRDRVNSLRLVGEGEDGLIVKSYDFDTKAEMETDVEGLGHLFMDRDGSTGTPLAVIQRTHDQYYLTLAKTREMDCIRDETGSPTATIEIVDRRGTPIQHQNATKYSLDKALDGTSDTYWAEVIMTDEPLDIGMNK